MGLLVLLVSLVFIWALLSVLVGEFADTKGHNGGLWFLFSLICSPLVGFILVAELPSVADLNPAAYKRCARCSNMLHSETDVCPYCDAELSEKCNTEKIAA